YSSPSSATPTRRLPSSTPLPYTTLFRSFVRALQGQYSLREELARLRAVPRVRKGKELRFVDGPQTYSRHYVEPKDGITQMFHLRSEEHSLNSSHQIISYAVFCLKKTRNN